jgi:hypothetical protein
MIDQLKQLLESLVKSPFHQRDAINMGWFLRTNAEKVDMWTITDGKETFVVMKWPHPVPELRVL